jgi:hypothetical protein
MKMEPAIFEQKEKAIVFHHSLRPYTLMGSLIALLLAITAGAGVLIANFYAPFITAPGYVAALWVQDLVSLLAAPVLVVAMLWTRRGSRRAFVVWCGVLVYTIYYYAFYVFGCIFSIFRGMRLRTKDKQVANENQW